MIRLVEVLVPVVIVALIILGLIIFIRAVKSDDKPETKYRDLANDAARVFTEILISSVPDDISILSEHDKKLLDNWMQTYRRIRDSK